MSRHDLFEGIFEDECPTLAIPPAIERDLASLRPVAIRRPIVQLVLVSCLALAYSVVLLVVKDVRRDLGELPMLWIAGAATAWAGSAAVALYLAIVPRRGEVMPRWRAAAAVTIGSVIGFVGLGLTVHPHGPSSGHYGMARLLHGHVCLEFGLVIAVVPAVLAAWLLRGTAPARPRWVAAAIGAGSGCLGGLFLHFHCRIADGPHVGLIHGGVVGAAALLAVWFMPRGLEARSPR